MRPTVTLLLSLLAVGCLALSSPALASDADGSDDCARDINDWGDAPEEILAYPGVPGRFPTCSAATPAGTQSVAPGCAPISSPPGPTGFVVHSQFGPGTTGNYWLGCYSDAAGVLGIDSELDGKTNEPPMGFSFCFTGQGTDCAEAAFGLAWDQDECYADGSDAGVRTPPSFLICEPASFPFEVYNCGGDRQVILNVLIDMNQDGDWNDVAVCDEDGVVTCAPEWALKNVPIGLAPGCNALTTPPFLIGPRPGPGWMRISLTDDPVPDDFPWAGSATVPSGDFRGGETEDYPVELEQVVPGESGTWGRVKSLYR